MHSLVERNSLQPEAMLKSQPGLPLRRKSGSMTIQQQRCVSMSVTQIISKDYVYIPRSGQPPGTT